MLVLAIRAGGIGPTLILSLATIGMGNITMVDHDYVEVSNLHWQVIHIEGRREKIKSRSVRDAMRTLNPTVSVTAVMDLLTWDKYM